MEHNEILYYLFLLALLFPLGIFIRISVYYITEYFEKKQDNNS